jgi:iron complex outermembrane receptor protein
MKLPGTESAIEPAAEGHSTAAGASVLRFVIAFGVLAGAVGWTQDPSPADLSRMDVEDLMNVKVTSVSKREQKLSQTPAAVFVIDQEDIRRSGATGIPDLLRMVPGLDVAQINRAVSRNSMNPKQGWLSRAG